MGHKHVSASKGFSLSPCIVTALALLYPGLLVLLVFLPGASMMDRLRWLDSGICAQLLTHSFYPGGERLPLCARNTGIYLGFLVTLITLYATGRGRTQRLPPTSINIALACGVISMAIVCLISTSRTICYDLVQDWLLAWRWQHIHCRCSIACSGVNLMSSAAFHPGGAC